MLCAACTAPPDVVAAHASTSVGGAATSGDEPGAAGAGGDEGSEAALRPLVGALDAHDPSALFDGDTLWIVSGGAAVLVRTTTDLASVEEVARIFDEPPSWVLDAVPDVEGIWSPELAYFGGSYHLYYAVSTIGSNRSCIGHATKTNLASTAPWLDHGPVICSNMDGSVDDWNAIDPNVVVDAAGAPWLSFGSFWGGLQLIPLTSSGVHPNSRAST